MLTILTHHLPHYDARPDDTIIDTVVVHCMYRAGLFPYDLPALFVSLDENKVAPHYSIARAGEVYLSVPENRRAWQAGESFLPEKNIHRVNDFSIGIELVGNPEKAFTRAQYLSLRELLEAICSRHPIKYLVGHDYIAPKRKVDPGPAFAWNEMQKAFPGLIIPQAREL